MVGGAEVCARVWARVGAKHTEDSAHFVQLFTCSDLFGADLTRLTWCDRYLYRLPKWLPGGVQRVSSGRCRDVFHGRFNLGSCSLV